MQKLIIILFSIFGTINVADAIEYEYFPGEGARIKSIKSSDTPKANFTYTRKGTRGEYNCCVEAMLPQACNEASCQETYPERIPKQVIYDVQFDACMVALNNAKKRGELKINDKTQDEYCKCVGGQMVERVDIKKIAEYTLTKNSAKILSSAEKHTEPSFRFCEEKMHLKIITK